jgi:hypothetical protein
VAETLLPIRHHEKWKVAEAFFAGASCALYVKNEKKSALMPANHSCDICYSESASQTKPSEP